MITVCFSSSTHNMYNPDFKKSIFSFVGVEDDNWLIINLPYISYSWMCWFSIVWVLIFITSWHGFGKIELFIVDDKFGTPTYTYDFAKNTEALIDTKNYGLYNMACQGNTSRYEVTEEILKILN